MGFTYKRCRIKELEQYITSVTCSVFIQYLLWLLHSRTRMIQMKKGYTWTGSHETGLQRACIINVWTAFMSSLCCGRILDVMACKSSYLVCSSFSSTLLFISSEILASPSFITLIQSIPNTSIIVSQTWMNFLTSSAYSFNICGRSWPTLHYATNRILDTNTSNCESLEREERNAKLKSTSW